MSLPQGRRLNIETPEAVTVSYPLAGLGSRGLAAFIDVGMLVALIIAELVAVALVLLLASQFLGDLAYAVFVWAAALAAVMIFLTYWGYYIFGEVVRNGRTLGKRVLKIRVVRDDGGRVGVLDSVVRNIVRIIDVMPGTYAVGIIASTFSTKAQRLGDMAAGTVVVSEPDDSRLDTGAGDEQAALVSAYLRRRADMTFDARYQVGASLLSTYAESPGYWDEPTIAGRLADLAGVRGSQQGEYE